MAKAARRQVRAGFGRVREMREEKRKRADGQFLHTFVGLRRKEMLLLMDGALGIA